MHNTSFHSAFKDQWEVLRQGRGPRKRRERIRIRAFLEARDVIEDREVTSCI